MLYFNDLLTKPANSETNSIKVNIHDMERLSDIKAHTIRIWEKRYDLFHPDRGDNNFRYYSIDELQRLLNISILYRNDYKISRLATMTETEIIHHLNKLNDHADKKERAINTMIICMYKLKTEEFEMVLNISCLTWGIDVLIKEIIYTFLKRTELLWQGSRLTEEHFIVTIIRKKLVLGIEKAEVQRAKEKSILLFLPDHKQLDLMLLYTNYRLKEIGWQVYYMGSDVTFSNLKSVLKIKQPGYALTYLPQRHNFPLEELSEFMNSSDIKTEFILVNYSDISTLSCEYDNIKSMNLDKAIQDIFI